MEITKELKEKLLKAENEEEVKALMGDEAAEEEVRRAWEEIKRFRATPEEVTDEELEAVSGGLCIFNGEYASDGKEVGCLAFNYHSWQEANESICPQREDGHAWEEIRRTHRAHMLDVEERCKLCGFTRKYSINKYCKG